MAIIVIAVGVLLGGVYFAGKSGTNPAAYTNDFNVYYNASREVMAGRDPYQRSLGEWTPYIYPPLLAEILVPIAFLPLPAAAYIWFLISAASTIGAAWMSTMLATERGEIQTAAAKQSDLQLSNRQKTIAVIALVVVLRFILDTFNLGQVNALVTGLAVAHVYLYTRGRKSLSALALVIAVSIKLTPVLLLFYHLSRRRFKFVLVCGALLVAVNVVSFLPFGSNGPGAFRAFVNRTLKNEQGYDFAYAGNQSLRGAIARIANRVSEESSSSGAESRKPADLTTLLLSIVLLAVAIFAASRESTELSAVAPFFCCMVLLSPLSWKAHYVILLLPAAYLISVVKPSTTGRYLVVTALAASFVLFNLTSPRVIGFPAAEWADAHSLVLVGALLIFAACIGSLRIFGKQQRVC